MKNELSQAYRENKDAIKKRLQEFKSLPEESYFNELIFCLLTPQSNAKKCWIATQEIISKPNLTQKEISIILKTKTRFHNNKSKYVFQALTQWPSIKPLLSNKNIPELREYLESNIKGYGLKEAAHFLRNIGKSNNQIAILDRHILRNLKSLNIISSDKIKNKSHYLELEKQFIKFSKEINIPLDELDLLFWSKETGEIFK